MIILRQREYSEGEIEKIFTEKVIDPRTQKPREVVPTKLAKKGEKSGVIQKDSSGNWRIISYKTDPPTFWNAKYGSKEKAQAALASYHQGKWWKKR